MVKPKRGSGGRASSRSGSRAGSRAKSAAAAHGTLLKLIDQKDTIYRYKELLQKISKGTLDTPGFIKAVAMDAALTAAHIMHTSTDEKVQLQAAQDILDRAGVGKTSKLHVGGQIHVDHDTAKNELISLILSSAARAGFKTSGGHGAMLEARKVGAVEMHPGDFVEAVAEEVKAKTFEDEDPKVLKEGVG